MSNLEVSLVDQLCPICGKVANQEILMNSLLTEEIAKEVKSMHGKAIGYADKCCEECSKYKDEVIFFIGADISKSDAEPYRTGQIAGIKRDSELAKSVKNAATLKDGTMYIFIDENIGKQIGLWK
jgi:hypothetical protein